MSYFMAAEFRGHTARQGACHFFNDHSHHRRQASAMWRQAGVTDLTASV
jgi:uncharacterized damage-inducible protein DinB